MHPILFHTRFLTVHSYGFCVAVAMAAVYLYLSANAEKQGLAKSAVLDLLFILFLSGIAGARLFYVLQHFSAYSREPLRIFYLQEGGLVWYGGFFLAVLAGGFYAKRRSLPVLRVCDFFSPALALAHAIGRLGCFLNGCCYGKVTNSLWGVIFPDDPTVRRIPTQLIESTFLFCLAIFLYYELKKPRKDGDVFIHYLFMYAAGRFLIEFLRGDQTDLIGAFTIPQWTSLVLVAAAFVFKRFQKKSS